MCTCVCVYTHTNTHTHTHTHTNDEAKDSMMLEHQDNGGGLGEECDGIKLLKGGLGVSASGWWVHLNPMTPRPIVFH